MIDIRDAQEKDLPAIVDIYNQSIPGRRATADTKPITVESRWDWFHNRQSHRPLWVATHETEVRGWLSFQNFYGRPAYLHTAEVSIYIATKYHHQGIGRHLLQQAIVHSPQLQLTNLMAFIFAHNQPSLDLFCSEGFTQWGYLPDIAILDGVNRSLIILGRSLF